MLGKGIGGNPCLDRRTTPSTLDDALSHALFALQLFAKEIADRREAPRILAIQALPGCGTQVGTGSMRIRLILHMKQAHQGIAVIQLVRILGRHALQRCLHIRLTSTQPDITQPHIGQFHISYIQDIRATRFHRWQVHSPMSRSISHSSSALLVEFHHHGLTRISLSPNRYRRTTLKHHSRLENLWQTHLGITHNSTYKKCK